MHLAIFFDRDGVLNVNHGYVHQHQHFDWIDGAKQSIKRANEANILTVVVTNQSGIAQGMYDEAAFHHLMQKVQEDLAEIGAHLDAIYHCPHGPADGCDCRKPQPGMILQAQRDLEIDLTRSLLVGDSPTDLEAAEAAGVRSVLFTSGNLLQTLEAADAFRP